MKDARCLIGALTAVRVNDLALSVKQRWPSCASLLAINDDAKPMRHPVIGRSPLTDMPRNIYLVGQDHRTLEALRRGLGGEVKPGPVEAQTFPPGTAIVSPANAFGWMDGGIDGAYVTMFGDQIERRVQQEMHRLYGTDPLAGTNGMPLGEAFVIRTYPEGIAIPAGKPEWLIVAPTMIRPGRELAQGFARPVATPDVAAKAIEAALQVAVKTGIDSIAIPGMGMGTAAGVDYNAFANAFGDAYDRVDEAMFG
jgi:O-acetyl-ADP-ribose deacetylase (regulator of RNase III)